MKKLDSVAEKKRFWECVDKRGENDCWPWQAAINSSGYGVVWVDGVCWKAHRAAWFYDTGNKPETCVCHLCDNPVCCNPKHLWLGTNAENHRDKKNKGRGRTSERKATRNPRNQAFCDYVTNPATGLPFRGAISRAADFCGVNYSTAQRWYFGVCSPKGYIAARLATFIQNRTPLVQKKRNDIGVVRKKYRRKEREMKPLRVA